MTKHKKAYFVSDNDEYGVAVVARDGTKARSMGYKWFQEEHGEAVWAETHAKKHSNLKVDHLPCGVIEDLNEGLRLGLYAFVENGECITCGADDVFVTFNAKLNKIECGECEEKDEAKN